MNMYVSLDAIAKLWTDSTTSHYISYPPVRNMLTEMSSDPHKLWYL